MAGAVARYVKWFYSTRMGVLNLISIAGLPLVGYILVQQEKQFPRLDEQERLQKERYHALIARGIIRVSEQ